MQITTQNIIIYQLSKQCSSIPLTDKHEGMKDKLLALHAWVHGAAYAAGIKYSTMMPLSSQQQCGTRLCWCVLLDLTCSELQQCDVLDSVSARLMGSSSIAVSPVVQSA
jgi:hypothetical protein